MHTWGLGLRLNLLKYEKHTFKVTPFGIWNLEFETWGLNCANFEQSIIQKMETITLSVQQHRGSERLQIKFQDPNSKTQIPRI